MNRDTKLVQVETTKFDAMSDAAKLALFLEAADLTQYVLSKIPRSEVCETLRRRKAEEFAEDYYRREGFDDVFRSRVKNGYRCIGTEFYWQDYAGDLTHHDLGLIETLKSITTPEDYEALAMSVEDKDAAPDLLLVKDKRISFVEVLSCYEDVKPGIVGFYLKHNAKWPLSILHIKTSLMHGLKDSKEDIVITLNNPTPEQIAWFNKL